MPEKEKPLRMPPELHQRLHELLDRQCGGETLSAAERQEAEELVDLAESISLRNLQARKAFDP